MFPSSNFPSGNNIFYKYSIISKPGNLNWYNCIIRLCILDVMSECEEESRKFSIFETYIFSGCLSLLGLLNQNSTDQLTIGLKQL